MGKDLILGNISFSPLFNAFNRTFKELDSALEKAFGETKSQIEVTEDKKKVYVKADVPGFDKEDLHVDVKNGYVFVEAEKLIKSEKDTTRRRISLVSKLPSDVTIKDAAAEYKDGILKISLNKKSDSCSKITIK